jgi:hypothetical protein
MRYRSNTLGLSTARPIAHRELAAVAVCLSLLLPTAALAKASSRSQLQYRFLAGERRVYQLSYANTAESDLRALLAGQGRAGAPSAGLGLAQVFRTQVTGEWVETVLGGGDKEVRIAVRLRRPTVRLWANGQEASAAADMLREELSRDLLIVADRQGRVRTVQLDPKMNDLSQSYARALLSLMQCVLPDRPSASPSRWTALEDDRNGQYIAQYEAEKSQPADGILSLRKRKIRYLQPRRPLQASNSEARPTVLPAGVLMIRFGRERGALVSLNGAETQTLAIRGTKVGRSVSRLQLQLLRQEKVASAELGALRQAMAQHAGRSVARRLSATESSEESEKAIQQRELGSSTLESLLADLAKEEAEAARDPNSASLATPLYLKIKALIYLHPEQCGRLGTLLASADPASMTASILTGALSAVGHPQAQAVLVDALRGGSRSPAAVEQGIAALAGVPHPTALAEAALRQESVHAPTQDLQVMAQLGLGTMARNLSDTEPARANKIVDEIAGKLRVTSNKEEARLGLMALGNAGSARALPALARFSSDRSPMLRASAVAALRWIEDPVVDARLIRGLLSDRDATVRQEAAGALGFREPTKATIAAQQRAFRTDRVESVRLAILANLGRAQGEFPEIRKLIQTAATGDASANVRKAAAALVTPSR